jgi:hypothetical protein
MPVAATAHARCPQAAIEGSLVQSALAACGMRFDSTATGILDRQVGVIARRQLVDCGYRIPQIDAMLRRGHLERVAPGIYRRTGSGNTARQQEVTALLWCGDEARLTGPRLLGYLGIEGYSDRSPFTVLVPRVRRIGIEHPVRCDLAPELHDAAYGPAAGTTPARVLAEMAVGRGFDDDALLRVFDLVRWRGVVDRARLRTTVADLPKDHPGAER